MKQTDAMAHQVVIGAVIATLRKDKGISQETFARAIGVSQPTLSRLERGQAVPDVILYSRMAKALDMSSSELNAIVDEALRRTESAAKGATESDSSAGSIWPTVLKAAGMAGLAGLAAFAVALVVKEYQQRQREGEHDEDEDVDTPPAF